MQMSNIAPVVLLLTVLLLTSSLMLSFNNCNATASSKTITVPNDFPNIKDAVGNATAGDTVYVKSGTYMLPEKYDYSLVLGKSISLVGESPQNTIIVTKQIYTVIFGMSYGIALHDDSLISGFTITGDYNPLILLGNGKITNNIINLTSSEGTAIWALSGNISSNIISGYDQEAVGIDTWGEDITVSNNIICNFGIGIFVGSNRLIVLNNTLTNNEIGFFIGDSPVLLWGNNVENSTRYGLRANFGVNVTYNWWGSNDSKVVGDTISASGYNQTLWGPIIYLPYLNASNPQAKPVQSMIYSPTDTSNEVPYYVVAVITAFVIGAVITILFLKRRNTKGFRNKFDLP